MIKKGDILIAMETFSKELTAGNEYTAMSSQDNYNWVIIKQDDGTMCTYHVAHFEVNQKPIFTQEYFSALNYQEAEKYVGKVMEFCDSPHKISSWKKEIFKEITPQNSFSIFYSAVSYYVFCRTCPETFQEPVKTFSQIINLGGVKWKLTSTSNNLEETILERVEE